MTVRPDFLVIGAQKAATSSVCHLLGQHAEVFMSSPKELYFFSHDEIWAKGWPWYEQHFQGAEGHGAVGEGSTTYTQRHRWPHAPDRIIEHLPGARLIFIAREPMERIRSQWMHLTTKGEMETRPFNQAVREDPWYITNSMYTWQLEPFRAHFPPDRIHVEFFEDFRGDPHGVMERCFGFLGVDPSYRPADLAPKHVSAEGLVDTGAMGPLRRLPFFAALRDAAPRPIREGLRRLLKKPIEGRPAWDPVTYDWARSRLAADAVAFLAAWGKPPDFWGADLAAAAGEATASTGGSSASAPPSATAAPARGS